MWTPSDTRVIWSWTAIGLLAAAACALRPPPAPAHRWTAEQRAAWRVVDRRLAARRRLDLNTADRLALEALPGIGPTTAGAIITERRARGPFAGDEDVRRVPGLRPWQWERARPFVRVIAPGAHNTQEE